MKLEWNLWIDEFKGISISGIDGQEPSVTQREGTLTADQHAALHFITEVARCLLMGKNLDHTFNPLRQITTVDEVIVRCHWLKSGKLVMMGESSKKWRHALSIEEAMLRSRVFTCTRALYDAMPKRRMRSAKLKPGT